MANEEIMDEENIVVEFQDDAGNSLELVKAVVEVLGTAPGMLATA